MTLNRPSKVTLSNPIFVLSEQGKELVVLMIFHGVIYAANGEAIVKIDRLKNEFVIAQNITTYTGQDIVFPIQAGKEAKGSLKEINPR